MGRERRDSGGGRLNVLIHRNTASNQCTALRLAEQLRGVRQQYIHVPSEGQREGGRASVLVACNTDIHRRGNGKKNDWRINKKRR